MRKIAVVAAAALMLGGTAYADGARTAAREARESMEQAGEKTERTVERGTDRLPERDHTVGDQMAVPGQQAERGQPPAQARGQQQAQAGGGQEQLKKDSFDIEGKVSNVSKDKLSLNREDAPMAELHVDESTKIELDGQRATLDQLQQGQDVQASFNLKGDKPMAVEIKAEKKQ